MSEQNRARGKPFRTSGADVVAGELFEHRAAHHARENGGQRGAESGGREGVIRRASPAGNREPAKLDGKKTNKNGAYGEIRNGGAKQCKDADCPIGWMTATVRGKHAGRYCDTRTDQKSQEREGERCRIAFENNPPYRRLEF